MDPEVQPQILRLTTPKLKGVWGPFPHPSDEDLSPGTPVRSATVVVVKLWLWKR
jgi:hypothetical protein